MCVSEWSSQEGWYCWHLKLTHNCLRHSDGSPGKTWGREECLRKWMGLARHTHSPRDHNSGPTKKDSGQVSGVSEHKRGWGGIPPCFRVSMEAVLEEVGIVEHYS